MANIIKLIKSICASQPLRFLLVGGLNTLFGYAVFSIFISYHLPYQIAMFLATCLGILFNFKSVGYLVFNNKKNHLIFKFMLVYFLLYLVNVSLISFLSFISPNLYLNGMIAILITAVLNYFLSKRFIFKENECSLAHH